MKLLILTQKIDLNDDVLGFMHGWVEEFSRQCEEVIVICLKQGVTELPSNVKVLSLGKETGELKIKYLVNFYKYIWQERKNYDAVFVHMNQIYVILGGLFWRAWHKKVGFWYAHGYVPLSLSMAEKLTHIIFTSTKSGFRLISKKKNVTGQGIDTGKFKPLAAKLKDSNYRIITVGRISPSKDYVTLIKAIEILNKDGVKVSVNILGKPATVSDQNYLKQLEQTIVEKKLDNVINFTGGVANKDIISFLQAADLFVNMGQTGSLDKAIVEAMACSLPVLTCNEALLEILGEYKDVLMYGKGDYKMLAQKISWLSGLPQEKINKIGEDLRQIVINNHSLSRLISKIMSVYEQKN